MKGRAFENIVGKGEKTGQADHGQNILLYSLTNNSFLDWSKLWILRCVTICLVHVESNLLQETNQGKWLKVVSYSRWSLNPIPDDKISDWSKLKISAI